MAGRKNKHAYLDDFEKDLNGNYQYRGAFYRYAGTPSRGRALAVLWLCCGGGAVLAVGAGVLPGATAHAPVAAAALYGGAYNGAVCSGRVGAPDARRRPDACLYP